MEKYKTACNDRSETVFVHELQLALELGLARLYAFVLPMGTPESRHCRLLAGHLASN